MENIKLDLLQKIVQQDYINMVLDAILSQNFDFGGSISNRINRGKIHSLVADSLNVQLNNILVSQVKNRLLAQGVKPIIVHGRLYYKHIQFKTGTHDRN